ncbi:MAG: AraC family transcriptional regulator [Chthoniobacteraceae bacterium]
MSDTAIYFPDGGTSAVWGAAVTACGHARTAPGEAYPPRPGEHPGDHLFWLPRGGRILDGYQLLYVSAGKGVFETASTGAVEVGAGSAFLLLPGVWHRYAPDPATGWVEWFVELRGPALEHLREAGVLRSESPVFHPGLGAEWVEPFETLLALAREGGVGSREEMSTLGMHLLARIVFSRTGREPSPEERAVRQAEARMRESLGEPLKIGALAREMGVEFDRFRRCFKALTGLPPKQYLLQLRMRRAEELLSRTGRSVTEIAAELGFNSAFHFSAAFKMHSGLAPALWRSARMTGNAP